MSIPPLPPGAHEQLKLENQLCFPFYTISRQLTKAYQPHLRALGLTYPQYLVLLLLWEHGQLTVKELGEQLLLDSGTLSPLLKRLESKQLLSRQRDPHDERLVRIALLPAGRALEARACDIPAQLLARLQLAPPALAALQQQLQLLLQHLA